MIRNFIFIFYNFGSCSKNGFSLRINSIQPFHCSGTCDSTQTLFGVCPSNHPFAFDNGKKCCDCQFEKNDKVKGWK